LRAPALRYSSGSIRWGAEDLPASIGAAPSREPDGRYTPPYELRAFREPPRSRRSICIALKSWTTRCAWRRLLA